MRQLFPFGRGNGSLRSVSYDVPKVTQLFRAEPGPQLPAHLPPELRWRAAWAPPEASFCPCPPVLSSALWALSWTTLLRSCLCPATCSSSLDRSMGTEMCHNLSYPRNPPLDPTSSPLSLYNRAPQNPRLLTAIFLFLLS